MQIKKNTNLHIRVKLNTVYVAFSVLFIWQSFFGNHYDTILLLIRQIPKFDSWDILSPELWTFFKHDWLEGFHHTSKLSFLGSLLVLENYKFSI